jgi:DNA replication and repair protein RecF
MYIHSLDITNFRNFRQLATDFAEGVNIFYGSNGSGKTNLLEAIFVLCLGRSHRSAVESVLVNSEADFYRIAGQINLTDKQIDLAVAYQKNGRKKATLDEVPIRLSELYDTFCVVAAGPEDSEIISGAPATRRLFIDLYLSQYSHRYIDLLNDYHRTLAQKNAALKREMDPAPFNSLLVEHGARIIKQRFEFLSAVEQEAMTYYKRISGGSNLSLEYRTSGRPADNDFTQEKIAEQITAALNRHAERERMLKSSLVGPHRDDIIFHIDGLPARSHGSQGEWRTAALSLKLAVYHLLKDKREIQPVLLLDEIFAELDRNRSEALIEAFADFHQLFLTTALEPPDFLRDNSRAFLIRDGEVALRE